MELNNLAVLDGSEPKLAVAAGEFEGHGIFRLLLTYFATLASFARRSPLVPRFARLWSGSRATSQAGPRSPLRSAGSRGKSRNRPDLRIREAQSFQGW